MASRSGRKSSFRRQRACLIEEDEEDDMDWLSDTAWARDHTDTSVQASNFPLVQMMRPESGYTTEQLRDQREVPRDLQGLTDQNLATFNARMTNVLPNMVNVEMAIPFQGDPARDAQNTDNSSPLHVQNAQSAESWPHPGSFAGVDLHQADRIGSQPLTFHSAGESLDRAANGSGDHQPNTLGLRLEQWTARRRKSVTRTVLGEPQLSDGGNSQPRLQRHPITTIPSATFSRGLLSDPRQISTQLDHDLRPSIHLDQMPAVDFDLYRSPQTEPSDDDEDPETICVRYHKKRRGLELPRIVQTTDIQRLEGQRMSPFLRTQKSS